MIHFSDVNRQVFYLAAEDDSVSTCAIQPVVIDSQSVKGRRIINFNIIIQPFNVVFILPATVFTCWSFYFSFRLLLWFCSSSRRCLLLSLFFFLSPQLLLLLLLLLLLSWAIWQTAQNALTTRAFTSARWKTATETVVTLVCSNEKYDVQGHCLVLRDYRATAKVASS